MYYILFYDYVADIVERRGPHRPAHLELAEAARAAGRIVLAGAYGDPVKGAAFIWRCDDASPIEAFVASDPYVANGLVTGWRIEPWNVVIGAGAT